MDCDQLGAMCICQVESVRARGDALADYYTLLTPLGESIYDNVSHNYEQADRRERRQIVAFLRKLAKP